ncbi:MAG TPA: hypothetical protein VF178_15990 [Gemmatimonadaceae bacterium]
MPIRWSTFITDAEGVVDYDRVNHFIPALLALVGGIVMVAAAVLEVATRVQLPTEQILIVGGALVLPMTGGQIASMAGKHLQAKAVARATATMMAASGPPGTAPNVYHDDERADG